jgi:RimJ/RimL family protein N-acetyltransferase
VTPAAGIAPVRIAGQGVSLRPFTEQEVAEVEHRVYDRDDATRDLFEFPMGPPPRASFRDRLLGSGRFVGGMLDLAIESSGQLVGEIQARNPKDCSPPGVYSLGVALWSEHRGRGIGREAVRLITGHLFTQEGARRVELSTDVENRPMRVVAERLGFVLEGVLRSFMLSGEGPRDYALYAMTRNDWGARGSSSPPGSEPLDREGERNSRSERGTDRTTWT